MNRINKRLKRIIFNKLYKDLSHVEIIYYEDSIWFIDRNEKYWYIEFEKNGKLWWRESFFINFFTFFSMERPEFEPLIGEWVEDVLNRKVVSTDGKIFGCGKGVEDVLNRKVVSTPSSTPSEVGSVEDVLNRKVVSTRKINSAGVEEVEDVLNRKVVSTEIISEAIVSTVEDVLNRKVVSTQRNQIDVSYRVEDVLNQKVVSTLPVCSPDQSLIEDILNVTSTEDGDVFKEIKSEIVLNSNN
jgi:hypothetical protein